MRPDALEKICARELLERRIERPAAKARASSHAFGSARFEQLLFVDDRAEQRREGIGEEAHAFVLQLRR